MFDYWRGLQNIKRRERKVSKTYRKLISQAKESNERQRAWDLMDEQRNELSILEDELATLETDRLKQLASQYRVPLPERDEDWVELYPFAPRNLTIVAAAKLRGDIRVEQKARWEWWQSRVQIAGSLVGIVGGIFGLLAYFKVR